MNPWYSKRSAKATPGIENITMFNLDNPAKVRYAPEDAAQDKVRLQAL